MLFLIKLFPSKGEANSLFIVVELLHIAIEVIIGIEFSDFELKIALRIVCGLILGIPFLELFKCSLKNFVASFVAILVLTHEADLKPLQ